MALTTVTGSLVSVNAIQGTLIADNAITAVHIATNAVSGTLIADNAITAVHIAQNSITVTQLADDCVESDKIADGIITTNHLNKAMISSQTEVTAATGDFVLLGDTSDSNNLKKTPVSSIIGLASGTTINNNANNRIITGSGTANTLEGEANLIFDGTSLGIGTANIDNEAKLHIEHSAYPVINLDRSSSLSDGNHLGYINFQNNGDIYGRLAVYAENVSETDGEIHFQTQKATTLATKMVITSDGNVGIGTTSPSSILHIEGDTNGYGTAPILYFGSTSTANAAVRDWAIGPADSNYGDFHIYQGASTGASPLATSNAKFTINASGNVGIGTTSPSTELHVKSTDQNALTVETDTAINQIHLSNSTNSPTYITQDSYALVLKADDNGWGGTASAIKFNVKGAEKARVTPDGVAMGDTDGDYTHRGATGGIHIKRGGLLMNGPPGNANMSSATNGNQWTYHGQGGRGGSFTSLTISVPNPNNGASGVGYGGFSLEFYIAGYNAKYHSGHFAGYVNASIVLSKRAFWDSSGSGTLTSGSVGAQGFYLTIGFPSMTHPTCKFVINKGGHGGSAGNAAWTDMDGVSVTWA